ncbi:RagB/SusD family nutrient uptake outer membrane protein [Pedobacter panaciterrae]|jgi:SusD family.|uniref:RagB/SusD family nutrient uptake outer membrane protein n=1 Tax=Pedobacter panaciterrae TaxID=363849 RepID=UPI00155DDE61|nr:RagB/SusD family nutrient uptake outer membrane protein [Pedobacter panaciterrae]NQX56401.1 RagB/SusD family nutrient uptake outer membrane protein [Pedobacter panaciterrae]
MKTNKTTLFITVILIGLFSGCKKGWLEANPDQSQIVPKTLEDFQALLDNSTLTFNIFQACGLAEIASGDFYILYSSWQSLFTSQEKSAYIWAPTANFYSGESSSDWENSYRRILNSNVILDGIKKIKVPTPRQDEWNNIHSSALFFRAFDFFNLAQEYCPAYEQAKAKSDLGLPLRLEYNVNIQLQRSTLQQTYDQIIKDLKSAIPLMGTTPLFKTRPSRQAAFALLARTYLAMEDYKSAGLYADSALQIQSDLIDYATLSPDAANPIKRLNPEVIFQSTFTYGIFNVTRLIVEPTLVDMYTEDDYRRKIFFKDNPNGTITYKGSYNGDKNLFGGLATDELFLIRAESNARDGKFASALADLNHLLKNRYNRTYKVININEEQVLNYIVKERRKELVFRGLRWQDLRRLNKDNRFSTILTRVLNNQTYNLLPNDKRYVFPIDEIELSLTGIQQNDR